MSCNYCKQRVDGHRYHDPCFKTLTNLAQTREWLEEALQDFYADLEKERKEVLEAKQVIDKVEDLKDPLKVPIWLRAWDRVREYLQLSGVPQVPGKEPVELKDVPPKPLKVEVPKMWGMLKEDREHGEVELTDEVHSATLNIIRELPGVFRHKHRPWLLFMSSPDGNDLVCIGKYTLDDFKEDWQTKLQSIEAGELGWLAENNMKYLLAGNAS